VLYLYSSPAVALVCVQRQVPTVQGIAVITPDVSFRRC